MTRYNGFDIRNTVAAIAASLFLSVASVAFVIGPILVTPAHAATPHSAPAVVAPLA